MGLTAAGLAFLAATLEGTADSAHASHSVATLYRPTSASATVAGLVLVPLARQRDGLMLAVSAGLLWGGSDVAIKAISDHADRGLAVVLDPLCGRDPRALDDRAARVRALAPARTGGGGDRDHERHGQRVHDRLSGPLVFREPLPDDALGLTVRMLAFLFVIAAAALIPAPGVREPLRT